MRTARRDYHPHERVGLDEEWVLRKLRTNAVMATRVGDRARRRQVVGKHLGIFIDKKSIGISCIDDADAYLSRITGLVDAKTVKHGPRRWRSTMTWWNPTAASIYAQVMSSIATGRDRTEPIEVSGSLGRCFRQLKLNM